MVNIPMIAEICSGTQYVARRGARLMLYRQFLRSDSGLATVEWVALAAGLVIGSIVVSFIVMQGLAGAANGIANQLSP